MLLMAVRTLDHVIVRIALCKCCFWSKWFVFHTVFFSRVSHIFFFPISPSFWFRLILVPPFAIGLLAGSCPFVHPYTVQVDYHVLPRFFHFCPKHDVPSNSYSRLHRTTSPNTVFFSNRHDNSNPAVNSVFISLDIVNDYMRLSQLNSAISRLLRIAEKLFFILAIRDSFFAYRRHPHFSFLKSERF